MQMLGKREKELNQNIRPFTNNLVYLVVQQILTKIETAALLFGRTGFDVFTEKR